MREYKFWLMVYACLVDVVSAAGHSRAIDDGNAPLDEDHAEGAASLVQAKAGHAVGVIHLHDKKGVDDDSGTTESDHDTSTLEVGVTIIDKGQIDDAIVQARGLGSDKGFQDVGSRFSFNVRTLMSGAIDQGWPGNLGIAIVAITGSAKDQQQFYVDINMGLSVGGTRANSAFPTTFLGNVGEWIAAFKQIGVDLPQPQAGFEEILAAAFQAKSTGLATPAYKPASTAPEPSRSDALLKALLNLRPDILPAGVDQLAAIE